MSTLIVCLTRRGDLEVEAIPASPESYTTGLLKAWEPMTKIQEWEVSVTLSDSKWRDGDYIRVRGVW